jgi:hypothetical protein
MMAASIPPDDAKQAFLRSASLRRPTLAAGKRTTKGIRLLEAFATDAEHAIEESSARGSG